MLEKIICPDLPEVSWPKICSMREKSEKKLLILAYTDHSCAMAKKWNLPCVAVKSDLFPKEELFEAALLYETIHLVRVHELNHIYRRFYGLPVTIFLTKRCRAQEIRISDLQLLYQMNQEYDIRVVSDAMGDEETEQEKLKSYIKYMYGFYGFGDWLFFEQEGDGLIARAGLNLSEDAGEPVPELGFAVLPEYRQLGYGEEICRGIITYAETKLSAYGKIVAFSDTINFKSGKLLDKLGFKKIETLYRNGRKTCKYMYVMTKNRHSRCFFSEKSL
ncbi:MAG: GNAT family N-acetyltransferase; N-acetyltransferase [Lachnospiraceae bacterium]